MSTDEKIWKPENFGLEPGWGAYQLPRRALPWPDEWLKADEEYRLQCRSRDRRFIAGELD